MAAVTEPVPGPSSTTTGSPLRGTTAASRAASVGELGATAPTVAGLRSTAARKAARCGGKSGMAPSLPATTPSCEVDRPSQGAEHCRATLAATARHTGISHVILLLEGAGDRAHTREKIIRLGGEVLPQLRLLS